MKIAAFTRGFDVDYTWKSSEHGFSDSLSDKPIRECLAKYSLKDCVLADTPGAAISKQGKSFGILITGLPTDYRSARPGLISVSFAFFEVNESVARSLVVGLLKDWTSVSEKLVSCILRHSPPACDPEWSIDVEGLSNCVGSVVDDNAMTGSDLFNGRRARPYSGVDAHSFAQLAEIVNKQSFSPGDGIKVIIGKPSSDAGQERLLAEADVLALPGMTASDNLKKKESETLPYLPSRRSTQQSNRSTAVGNLVEWVVSLLRKPSFWIICGSLLAIVIGIRNCEKKRSSNRNHGDLRRLRPHFPQTKVESCQRLCQVPQLPHRQLGQVEAENHSPSNKVS